MHGWISGVPPTPQSYTEPAGYPRYEAPDGFLIAKVQIRESRKGPKVTFQRLLEHMEKGQRVFVNWHTQIQDGSPTSGGIGYGGRLRRAVAVELQPEKDKRGPDLTWADIVGNIPAWEAWNACVRDKMELQGIVTKANGMLYRIFRDHPWIEDKPDYLETLWCSGDGKGVGSFYRPFQEHVDEVLYSRGPWTGRALLVQKATSLSSYHLGTIHLVNLIDLLEVDRILTPLEGQRGGWSIANIWRTEKEMMQKQADLWEMSVEHLKERIEGRSRAAERRSTYARK